MELGRDEQQPTQPFMNLINPTDLDKVVIRMYELIREYHNWDWVNVALQYRIGGGPLWFGLAGEPIRKFLQRLILEMRKRKKTLTAKTSEMYKTVLQNKYDYSDADIADYFQSFMELQQAGQVPKSISHPWGYTPSTIGEDIGRQLTGRIGLFVLGGIAIWGLSTTFIPQVTDAVTGK